MSEGVERSPDSGRPYRSHKIRACDHCRRRKQRCVVAALGEPCRLCTQQKIRCSYEQKFERRTRLKDQTQNPNSIDTPHDNSTLISHLPVSNTNTISSKLQQSRHIIGPVESEDAHVLEQYMTPASLEDQRSNQNPYNVYSADPTRPVLYTKVDRRRAGLMMSEKPGLKQKLIMDQILAGNIRAVIEIYLSRIYPCFPVVDRREVETLLQDSNAEVPATLLCTLYAITLTSWSRERMKLQGPRPDQRFFWNLSVKALSEDFLAPGLSSLQAVLVDLVGRPSFSIIGNVINNGRAVSLASSLGLNRNPEKWNINDDEKHLRTRVWWGVLIHDLWGSYTHGVPPSTDARYRDVPIPSKDDLAPCNEYDTECFRSLCQLTNILGKIVPFLYDLRGASGNEIRQFIREIETEMEKWEEALPIFLQAMNDPDKHVEGASNLHLSYLSIRMLICRLSLVAIGRAPTGQMTPEALLYHQSECKRSAVAILDFVESMQIHQLTSFWLPYCAYHLTSATTLLLRFAVETTNDELAISCIASVRAFVRKLQDLRDRHSWELGNHCLAQCEAIVDRLSKQGRPQVTIGDVPAENMLDAPFDLEPSANWLDSSLMVSFGDLGGHAPERDLWELLGLGETGTEDYVF